MFEGILPRLLPGFSGALRNAVKTTNVPQATSAALQQVLHRYESESRPLVGGDNSSSSWWQGWFGGSHTQHTPNPSVNLTQQRSLHTSAHHLFPQTSEEFEKSAILTTSARKRMMLEVDPDSPFRLIDDKGKGYLDASCGIAVSSLGHLPPELTGPLVASYLGSNVLDTILKSPEIMRQLPDVTRRTLEAAVKANVKRLAHVSATHNHKAWEDASKILVNLTGDDKAKVFWTSDGTAANEAAIKGMQKYHAERNNPNKKMIITFEGAFHGRTLASLAATGNKQYQEGFYQAGCFKQVPYGDLNALEEAIKEIGPDNIAGILGEPMQGEGGGRLAPESFWPAVRRLCEQNDMLLTFDEVQVGMGRCGTMRMSEQLGVEPDITTFAKALGGGVAVVSAALFNGNVASVLTGSQNNKIFQHGVTHTGFPASMLVAKASIEHIQKLIDTQSFKDNCAFLQKKTADLQSKFPDVVHDIRGKGFNYFLQLKPGLVAADVAEKIRDAGLLVMPAGDNCIRIQPPLDMSQQELQEIFTILGNVYKDLQQEQVQRRQDLLAKQTAENPTIFTTKQIVDGNVHYHALRFDNNSPLLKEFFALRKEVYDREGMCYYPDGAPDDYDKSTDDNIFIVAIDKYTGKVIGGRRMLMHEPGTDTILHVEKNCVLDPDKHKSVKQMLPHINDIKNKRYAELGSLFVDPKYRGNGTVNELYKLTALLMREQGIDFVISEVTPDNIRRFQNLMSRYCKQVVCRVDLQAVGDNSFDSVWIVTSKSEKELPLLSKEMIKAGIGGFPTDAEIQQKRELQRAMEQRPTIDNAARSVRNSQQEGDLSKLVEGSEKQISTILYPNPQADLVRAVLSGEHAKRQ